MDRCEPAIGHTMRQQPHADNMITMVPAYKGYMRLKPTPASFERVGAGKFLLFNMNFM